MKYKALTATKIHVTVLLLVAMSSLVRVYQRFGGK
jgi:hypothetical protein